MVKDGISKQYYFNIYEKYEGSSDMFNKYFDKY